MNIPLPEIAITAALACGFGAVGEFVLRRRSIEIAAWNESLLVGMGVCAAWLFPLSLLLPTKALLATAVLMGLAAAWAVVGRLARRFVPVRHTAERFDPATRLVLGATVLVALCFAALNFRYNYLWDGFQIWGTKAQLLFHRGGLTPEWFPGDLYDSRLAAYPPLVPLYEALLSLLRRRFDFDKLKPVFLVFYVSMLLSTFAAVRAASSRRLAAFTTLLLCLVPALSTQYAAGGYADMPQAALLAGVVAASLKRGDPALPWLIGALTMVKAEGLILGALACAAILVSWLIASPRGVPERIRSEAKNIAIVACLLGIRIAHGYWIRVPDGTFARFDAFHLGEALRRIPYVARLCIVELARPSQWGLLWPAVLAAALVLAARGTAREKSLAIGAVAGVPLLALPFLFTTWPLDLHVAQAYFRLLAQLAPAAVTVTVLGYARAQGDVSTFDGERAVSS